jgi:hypothetical protein
MAVLHNHQIFLKCKTVISFNVLNAFKVNTIINNSNIVSFMVVYVKTWITITTYLSCLTYMLLSIHNIMRVDVFLLFCNLGLHNTECNRIRYTNLKIYCDQNNSNITTQFLTEHLLTVQVFCKCSIRVPLVMRQTSRRYSYSSHSLPKKVTVPELWR